MIHSHARWSWDDTLATAIVVLCGGELLRRGDVFLGCVVLGVLAPALLVRIGFSTGGKNNGRN